jgi:hypothetical protein
MLFEKSWEFRGRFDEIYEGSPINQCTREWPRGDSSFPIKA